MSNKKNLKPESQQILPGFESGFAETGRISDRTGVSVQPQGYNKPRENRVGIRIATEDLEKLKSLALAEGMPYHSLLSRIIHEYVNAERESKKGVVTTVLSRLKRY